ncbi:MAG: hypothetical protein ABI348_04385, partial [Nitrososphaera sp.]
MNNNKKYLAVSLILIASFLVLAILVSPRVNPASNSGVVKYDSSAFLAVNNSHLSSPFNQFMILLTEYGREAVWIATGVLIFVF